MIRRGRGVVRAIIGVGYRLMDGLRAPTARTAATQPPTGRDFTGFAHARQCLLVTRRRSGVPVPSPLNFGLGAGGRMYVRTDADSAKVVRLRRDPHVVVVPCTARGRPLGPGVSSTARLVPAGHQRHADAVVAANWSMPMKLLERGIDLACRLFDLPMAYIEITPEQPHG